jgi:hypothetical protein
MSEDMKQDDVQKTEGAFFESLKRNNRQIRQDRAETIAEDAEMTYKRTIEDMEMEIKRKKRDQEAMLDMSPENTTTLKLASDFDAKAYVEKDIELGTDIYNLEKMLVVARERYHYLFGGK